MLNGEQVVHIEGELTLATSAGLQRTLLDHLQPGKRTVLDASGIAAVDLAGLQLICSAHRTYVLREAEFVVSPMSEALKQAARASGFEASRSVCPYRCGGQCIWKW
ncbi:MAG TPA: STAS domain-containing protein [Bryobacteraceae bacterium]|jgi:anti-anti-sigma factor